MIKVHDGLDIHIKIVAMIKNLAKVPILEIGTWLDKIFGDLGQVFCLETILQY